MTNEENHHNRNSPNGLEKIILDDDMHSNKNVLEMMFSDKTKNLKATVKALLEEIDLRHSLNQELLNKISSEKFEKNVASEFLDRSSLHYTFEGFTHKRELREQIEKDLLELNKEERKEKLECWRDQMFLRKYLMGALRGYWNAVKRRQLLKGKD